MRLEKGSNNTRAILVYFPQSYGVTRKKFGSRVYRYVKQLSRFDVINQKRVRVFDRGFQTPRNR